MPSSPLDRPLSRLFSPAAPPDPSLNERIAALDAASPEQLATLATAEGNDAVRAAAIERLPYGECLRKLAGLDRLSTPSSELTAYAQQRLATLLDAQSISWRELRSDSENAEALLQITERCSDPACLEQAVASIADPQQIVRLVLEGGTLPLRQAAARRIDDHEDVHRLLKQLQGKDKSVYRILKDKRDAWRADVHKAEHIEQDIRTIYTSLEALHARPYDALFAPALEHFEARWRTFEGQAQPWARDRVRAAIDRCRAILDAHVQEEAQQAARLAEQSAREAAQHAARAEAEAKAAEAARERDEAAAQAAAQAEELRQAEEKARVEREAAHANALRQIAALMARAHGALRAGHTGPAAGLRRAIEEKLSAALPLPASLSRGLQELDAKLQAMKDWKDYAAAPKRAELIAEMEALAGS
jgi:DNA repair protein SbcC/Rad50